MTLLRPHTCDRSHGDQPYLVKLTGPGALQQDPAPSRCASPRTFSLAEAVQKHRGVDRAYDRGRVVIARTKVRATEVLASGAVGSAGCLRT